MKHSVQVPYSLYQDWPSNALDEISRMDLPWDVQQKVRSWCELRAGLLRFWHINGKESQAVHQYCIFCGTCIRRNPIKHVLGSCGTWGGRRGRLIETMGWDQCSVDVLSLHILRVTPQSICFHDLLDFSHVLANSTHTFWATRGNNI